MPRQAPDRARQYATDGKNRAQGDRLHHAGDLTTDDIADLLLCEQSFDGDHVNAYAVSTAVLVEVCASLKLDTPARILAINSGAW